MAEIDNGYAGAGVMARGRGAANIAGSAVSLALMLGVGIWGYKLIIRDVSGIPVVRAMDGDMRVLPDDPGGSVAPYTGFAVNAIAAEGEAEGPMDRLVLAPRGPELAREDLLVAPLQATVPALIETPVETVGASVEDVLAMVADITTTQAQIAPAALPVAASSLRPVARPAARSAVPAAAPVVQPVAVSAADFASGTDLVQLGAFSSPDLAGAEWARLVGRFGVLMNGRERVIQVSTQTSGTWYRLRASGFADRDDARRFCAALQAEGAECIAVVVN